MKRSDFSHYRGVFIASGEERKRKRNRTRERIVLRMTGLVTVPVPYMTSPLIEKRPLGEGLTTYINQKEKGDARKHCKSAEKNFQTSLLME